MDAERSLKPFQRLGVEFIKAHSEMILADKPGLGKTIQTIMAIDEAALYPCLVVCPKSVKLNWVETFWDWAKERVEPDLIRDITIINYEQLRKRIKDLKAVPWEIIVCDEAHVLKNRTAKKTILIRQLMRRTKRKLLITGTYVLNRPEELASLLEIINKLKEFGGLHEFYLRYCGMVRTVYGWDYTGVSNLQELHDRLSGFVLRRTKEEIKDELSPKEPFVVPFNVNRTEYNKLLLKRYNSYFEREESLAMEALKAKEESCFEWIENFLESGEKLVVFAHHRYLQNRLCERFPLACRISGGQTDLERKENIVLFQLGDRQLIICSLKAAGLGITLTAASDIAFLEFPQTPGILEQAIDRVHRIGQHKSVFVWYLYAKDTVEEKALCLCENKEVITSLIQDGESHTSGVLRKMIRE